MDANEPGESPDDSNSELTLATRAEAFAELAELNEAVDEDTTGTEFADPDDTVAATTNDLGEAPAVVVVMVTHDPGDWLEETLGSLDAQNYPNLSVLIIDAASEIDPTPRIARVLPGAFVRRLEHNRGFGPSLNEVLSLVQGASFYCFCHDDVALDPNAIRRMIEEAFRSNAGVVGPKLVDWDDPEILLQVGMSADKTGSPAPYAERGELDQEQHDAVRDVFTVPGGCTLVRADLFAHLGGFDPGIDLYGEDLDLCWRVHLVGARVVVAPAAQVRHREAMGERRSDLDVARLTETHRIRTMLSCYRLLTLIRVIPQAMVISLIEAVFERAAGRRGAGRAHLRGWLSTARHPRRILAARRRIGRLREVSDRDIRHLQARSWARLTTRWQSLRRDREAVAATGRSALEAHVPRSLVPYGVAAILVLLVLGSRELFFGPLPALGEFARGPRSPGGMISDWLGGWNAAGLGSDSPVATITGVLGVLGGAALGSVEVIRRIGILGMLPVGLWGAWRLASPLGIGRARLAALVVYAAVPVPYNALSQGRWSGLVAYAAAPWLLRSLARAMAIEPFAAEPTELDEPATDLVDPEDPRRRPGRASRVLGLGLGLGVVALAVPAVLGVALILAVGLALGSVALGRLAGVGRLLVTVVLAIVVAVVLQVPTALGVFEADVQWPALLGLRSASEGWMSLAQVLRFESGPAGAGPFAFAFLVAGLLPLVIGRGWRLEWAGRAWGCAVVAWGVLWVGQQSWSGVALPPAEVLLAPAAAGVALAVAIGVAAFDIDLPGYRFGWRQAASIAAGVAVVLGILPLASGAVGGRWRMPEGDITQTLSFVEDQRAEHPFSVLWIGDAEVVPVAGWRLEDDFAYAISDDGLPTMTELWAPPAPGGSAAVADALHLAFSGQTSRLGALLATMNVRYVVVPTQIAPAPSRGPAFLLPESFARELDDQLDLSLVTENRSVEVFENRAWEPGLVLHPSGTTGTRLADAVNRDAGIAVLPGLDPNEGGTGRLPAGGVLALGVAADDGWRLSVDGVAAEPVTLDGWQQGFVVPEAGTVTLTHLTPASRRIGLAIQALLWVGAVVAWRRLRPAVDGGSDADGTAEAPEEGLLVQLTESGHGEVVPVTVDDIDVDEFDEHDLVGSGRDGLDAATDDEPTTPDAHGDAEPADEPTDLVDSVDSAADAADADPADSDSGDTDASSDATTDATTDVTGGSMRDPEDRP